IGMKRSPPLHRLCEEGRNPTPPPMSTPAYVSPRSSGTHGRKSFRLISGDDIGDVRPVRPVSVGPETPWGTELRARGGWAGSDLLKILPALMDQSPMVFRRGREEHVSPLKPAQIEVLGAVRGRLPGGTNMMTRSHLVGATAAVFCAALLAAG